MPLISCITEYLQFSCCFINADTGNSLNCIFVVFPWQTTMLSFTFLGPVYMEWGTPVQWGKFLLFSRSGRHKTKETYPTRPGSPTPCKQGLISLRNLKAETSASSKCKLADVNYLVYYMYFDLQTLEPAKTEGTVIATEI